MATKKGHYEWILASEGEGTSTTPVKVWVED